MKQRILNNARYWKQSLVLQFGTYQSQFRLGQEEYLGELFWHFILRAETVGHG